MLEGYAELPTTARPLLVGILVDVSGSMVSSSLRSTSESPGSGTAQSETRIQSVSKALDDLVAQGAELSQQGLGGRVAPLLKIFMYGFGFGGVLSGVLSALFGGGADERPAVRDLLALPGKAGSTVGIDELATDWLAYRRNIETMLPDMLGATPMASAFRIAKDRFHQELADAQYAAGPVLLVISDGEPTPEDWTANPFTTVRELATAMKSGGVTIISCLLTQQDVTEPRRLYGVADRDWPPGAQLLFDCASELPAVSPFYSLLSEYRWTGDPGARLFAQINHSDVLSEFSKLVLSRLPSPADLPAGTDIVSDGTGGVAHPPGSRPIRVFVSYSHNDRRFLRRGELLDYLSGLQREGVEFWSDERIETGDAWDDRIKDEIARADIALVLVSQQFLNSRYCQDVEVRGFLEARKAAGLRIFPVILSPCDWTSFSWLRETQVQPRVGTVQTDYTGRGKRAQLYLEILNELRSLARERNG